MKRANKIALAVAAALSLGLAVASVSAHAYGYGPGWHMGGYGPGPGYGPGSGYGPGPGYGMGSGFGMGPGAGMRGRGMGPQAMFGGYYGDTDENLAALKGQLGITAAQENAWQAFVKNAKQRSENRQAWFAKMQQARAAGSMPEFLAQQAETLKQREADMEANAAALKNLYTALTPEQKAIAEQSFGGPGSGNCPQAFGGPRGRFR